MNIFDCAIKMEEDAKEYYTDLAKFSTVPELKSLFSLLAAAEDEHRAALVGLKEKNDPQKVSFNALDEAACVFRPILDRRELMTELKDDPDAYRHAVLKEEEGVRFYEELAARAEDEESRDVLLMIAREERKHLNIVENIYSFVESPRTYLAWGEFGNLAEY